MPALMHIAESLPEEERNMRIHAGDILVFRGPPRMSELLELLRSHCCRFLGSDPEQIHSREPAAAIEARLEHLRAELRRDERIGWAWHAVIEALGADTGNTYGDGVVVRGQPPQNAAGGVRTAPLSAHRDTWGSNIAAQTNWWAPLYTTTPERTLVLYPGYFDNPVANDSAGWDFRAMIRAQQTEPAGDYPLLPTVTATPPAHMALPISLCPGDLLCFSGAHLHASAPNMTDRTRLSFETRTVNGADIESGRGAPNVDGNARCTTYQLFRHIENRRPLGALLPSMD